MAILNEAHGARREVNRFFDVASQWLKDNAGKEEYKTNDDVLNGLKKMYNDYYTKSTGELTNPEGLTTDRISRILGIPKGDEAFSSEAYEKTTSERLKYWHSAIEKGKADNDKRIADYFERPFDVTDKEIREIDSNIGKIEHEVPAPVLDKAPEPIETPDEQPSTNIVKPSRPHAEEKPTEPVVHDEAASDVTETPGADPAPAPEAPVEAETPAAIVSSFDPNTFLTIAGVLAATAGIIALIRTFGRGLKARFQKYCKMLFKMQKDFIYAPNGLDMTSVAGDKGNIFTKWFKSDNWARWLFGNNKIDKETQIGVVPFVNTYRNEIANDYQAAVKAYNSMPMTKAKGEGAVNDSINETVYTSFYEALKDEIINETADTSIDSSVNESALLTMGLSIAGGIATRALLQRITAAPGTFMVTKKDKNGNEKQVPVQVTKQSTREICLAIIGQFLDKYVNNEAVFKRMGMDIDRLQDINSSTYEKFKKVLEAFRGDRDRYSNNQFQIMQRGWDSMIKSYDEAGQRIIKNFRKYTVSDKHGAKKDLSEKTANNLEAADMKLVTAWNLGINKLKGNFPSIITAVVSSPEYTTYYDFIIEKVLPVFKSGLAGDADYVLDVYPKANDYYIIRQTEGQPVMPAADSSADVKNFNKGIALCKVIRYNMNSNQITFKLISAVSGKFHRNQDGTVNINDLQFETSKDNRLYDYREVTLPYNKWAALDPVTLAKEQIPEEVKYEPDAQVEDQPYDTNERIKQIKRITPVYKKLVPIPAGGTQMPDDEEFIFGFDYDSNESRSTEEKTYTEDTALYDSVNEADADTEIKGAVDYKKANDATNIIGFEAGCSSSQFVQAISQKYQEEKDSSTADDITRAALDSNDKIAESKIKDVSQLVATLDKLSTSKDNEISTQDNNKISEVVNNIIQFYQNIDLPNKVQDASAWVKTKQNVVVLKVGNSYYTRIPTSFIDETGKAYAIAMMTILNGTLSQNGNYRLLMRGSMYAQGKKGQLIFNGIDVTSFATNNPDINAVKNELTDYMEKAIKHLRDINLQLSSVNIAYSTAENIDESIINKSTITISRNIDKGKFKELGEYFILSENVWNDGNINDIEESLRKHTEELLNMTQNSINEAIKSSKELMIKPFAKSLSYKVRLPKNRFSLMTEGNCLYESVVAIKFDKKGNIESSYDLGIHKIEL